MKGWKFSHSRMCMCATPGRAKVRERERHAAAAAAARLISIRDWHSRSRSWPFARRWLVVSYSCKSHASREHPVNYAASPLILVHCPLQCCCCCCGGCGALRVSYERVYFQESAGKISKCNHFVFRHTSAIVSICVRASAPNENQSCESSRR